MTEETGQRIAAALERIADGLAPRRDDDAPHRHALRLITTWTTPGLATPETVAYAHEKARQMLGLPNPQKET